MLMLMTVEKLLTQLAEPDTVLESSAQPLRITTSFSLGRLILCQRFYVADSLGCGSGGNEDARAN